MEVAKQLQVAGQMHNQIKAIPAATKIISAAWNPTSEIQEAKEKAAEEYYNQGYNQENRFVVYFPANQNNSAEEWWEFIKTE